MSTYRFLRTKSFELSHEVVMQARVDFQLKIYKKIISLLEKHETEQLKKFLKQIKFKIHYTLSLLELANTKELVILDNHTTINWKELF